VGILAVDVSTFGVVISADSQPVDPVASLDDLAYLARQRMEFLKRLYSQKHGIYTKSSAPLDGEVHVFGVNRKGVMKTYPKIRSQAKEI